MITIFTIEEMRVHVGLEATDDSQDAAINAAMEVAIGMAEAYADRKFQLAEDTESFTHVAGYSIQLHRFPVIEITSVLSTEEPPSSLPPYHAHLTRGILYFDGRVVSHALTVIYEGGYGPLTVPAELRWALYRIFDAVWNIETGSGVEIGSVKAAKIADMSITYETGASSMSLVDGLITTPVGSILNKYKRYSA